MKPFGELISFETAQEIIERHILPMERTRSIKIDNALGRVLVEDITARHFTPPFDRSAMDGYAVKWEDTIGASKQNPKKLKIVGVLYASSIPSRGLSPGESIKIATGAPMPAGADAVVIQENTESADSGGMVSIIKPASVLENVSPEGEDIKKGEVVLKHGMRLDASKIGVLASQGFSRCKVYDKPIVAIIPTGEEIIEIGKRIKAGQIYDINSHTISAIVTKNAGIPLIMPITKDRDKAIGDNLVEAISQADIVVTSGGSSVGDRDLIIDVLKEWGDVLLHGINIRPGKPTAFAIVKGKPVLCMPGYPVSCLMNAHLLLSPLLRKMARLPYRHSFSIQARLGASAAGGSGRRRFLPVRLEGETAHPILKGSSAITSMARADGYIIIDENKEYLEKDSLVNVFLL